MTNVAIDQGVKDGDFTVITVYYHNLVATGTARNSEKAIAFALENMAKLIKERANNEQRN